MDTASFQFVAFGLAAALISNLSRSRVWRSIVLLLASLVFLGLLAQSPIVLIPLAAFLLLGYGGLVLLEHGWSRSSVWSILAVLLVYWTVLSSLCLMRRSPRRNCWIARRCWLRCSCGE